MAGRSSTGPEQSGECGDNPSLLCLSGCPEGQEGGECGDNPGLLCLSGCPEGQEVIPEGEVVFENDGYDVLKTRYKNCKKHPGHPNFISVNDFKVEDLPPQHRTRRMMEEVFRRSVLTVGIKVRYTSEQRPDTFADSKKPYPFSNFRGNDRIVRYGTGRILTVFHHRGVNGNKKCPCPPCRKSGQPKEVYWWIRVRTATHMIYDRSEAENAAFECFYDTDDRKGVKIIYGFDTFNIMRKSEKMYRSDICDVLCVTHDRDTVAVFDKMKMVDDFFCPPVPSKTYAPSKVIISHPHGCSKKITVGNVLHMTVPVGTEYQLNHPIPFPTGTIYRESLALKSVGFETSENQHGEPLSTRVASDNGETGDREYDTKQKSFDSYLDYCIDSTQYNLKEMLEAVKKNDDSTSDTEDETVPDKIESGHSQDSDWKNEYIAEFYTFFLREQVLSGLLACVVLYNKIQGKRETYGQEMIGATQEILRTFVHQEDYKAHGSDAMPATEKYEASQDCPPSATLEAENEPNTTGIASEGNISCAPDRNAKMCSSGTADSKHFFSKTSIVQEIYAALRTSEDKFFQFISDNHEKSESDMTTPSMMVSFYLAIEHIMNTTLTKLKHEHKTLNENLVPDLCELVFMSLFKILTDRQKHVAGRKKEEDASKETVSNISNKLKDDKKEKIIDSVVPDESVFTLPHGAEYAFRVHSRSPGWISFPLGTTMTVPDGVQKSIGGSHYEFKFPTLLPQRSYVTYDINTCPGSSGANVYCDFLGQGVMSYFPHSGCLTSDVGNRSGIRDNIYSLYSRMMLFGGRSLLKGDGAAKQSMSVVEVTISLLSTLQDVFRKST